MCHCIARVNGFVELVYLIVFAKVIRGHNYEELLYELTRTEFVYGLIAKPDHIHKPTFDLDLEVGMLHSTCTWHT